MPPPGTFAVLKDCKLGGESLHTGCSADLSFPYIVLEDLSLPQDPPAGFYSLLWRPIAMAPVVGFSTPFMSLSVPL